jgi:hypothetical protein
VTTMLWNEVVLAVGEGNVDVISAFLSIPSLKQSFCKSSFEVIAAH